MRISLTLFVCMLVCGTVFADGLTPGSTAPALSSVEWVSGDAVNPAEAGAVKVLVFWTAQDQNTGPVFNLLNEIKKQHADLRIGALTADPVDQTRQILLQIQVPFSVGVDAGGAGLQPYLAGAPGIPYSVVIGADGKVVWTGHPLGMMRRVVTSLKAGTYDAAQLEKAEGLQQELQQAMQGVQSGQTRPEELVTILDKLIANEPTNSQWYNMKIQVFAQTGSRDKVGSVFQTWYKNVEADAEGLSNLASTIMGMDHPDLIDPVQAKKAADKAWALDKGKTVKVGLAVARVYERLGLFSKAVEVSTASKGAAGEAEIQERFDSYIRYLNRLIEAQKAAN